MTTNERFERGLAAWLHDDAAFRVPDHLDEVLAATTVTGQRPAWSSLERWLPVDTTFRPRLFDMPSAGRLLAVAALILVLVAVAVFAIGSQHRLPPPFGLARNGTFVETRDGDIYITDPKTSEASLLVGGDAYDFSAVYSRDGTKFAFLRSDTGKPSTLPGDVMLTMFVANADGSDVHAITPLIKNLDWFDWSPDSTRIAYVSNKSLYVVDLAGGAPRQIKGTGPAHFPTWLPPRGDEIVYRLEVGSPAIMAIPADGSGKRRVLSTTASINEYDYQGISVDPVGRHIAFTRWSSTGRPSVHAVDLMTGTVIDYPTTGAGQMWAVYSPDASLIAYARLGPGNDLELAIANADGSGGERVIGPVVRGTSDGATPANWAFTPDGTAIIMRVGDDARATTHLIPVDGSESRLIETGAYQFIDVQRLAP
jgi:Tol biopolymer transport system component